MVFWFRVLWGGNFVHLFNAVNAEKRNCHLLFYLIHFLGKSVLKLRNQIAQEHNANISPFDPRLKFD